MPGFIAKSGLKEIPSVGVVARSIGSVFMDRTGTSKEAKLNIFNMILER